MKGLNALAVLLSLLAISACTPRPVTLANPFQYEYIARNKILPVPCYYAIAPETDAVVLESWPVQVHLGKSLAGQLHATLSELCTGTGRVADRTEFLKLSEQEPSLLFRVEATGTLHAPLLSFFSSTGSVDGSATITGNSDAPGIKVVFTGYGRQTLYPGIMVTSGAEGLRKALQRAVQDLTNGAIEHHDELKAIAG